MESDLLDFISSIQLKMENHKERSDLVLNTLCLYAEGKISRKSCVNLIFLLLTGYPTLLDRFGKLIEETPPPSSNYGALISDPFVNTIIEFELWPGVMNKLLLEFRSVMTGEKSLIDAICNIEAFLPTSGPFWLLWDAFQPISQTNNFIQLLFDGCVDTSLIPPHLNCNISPSEVDADPSLATLMSIYDSDVFCVYKQDVRNTGRPIGPKRIGSYGLLIRSLVDNHCSGRKIGDFAVTNNRWSTAAAGLDVIFCHAKKNQYEEKLFLNEDERVDLDVRISRYRSTLKHIAALEKAIQEDPLKVYFKKDEFKYNFTALDIYTFMEIYGSIGIEDFIESIATKPIEVLPLVYSRIEEKVSDLTEYRKSKESEYYDLNKKNARKSLDVSHEVKTSVINFKDPMLQLAGGANNSIEFGVESRDVVYEVLLKTAKISTVRSSTESVNAMVLFIKGMLGDTDSLPAHKGLVFHAFHAITEDLRKRRYFLTADLYRLLSIFNMLQVTFNMLNCEGNGSHSSGEDEVMARGREIAKILGHIPTNSNKERITKERVVELVPQFVYGSKTSNELEEAFDMPSNCINSFDVLRKALQQFVHFSVSAFNDKLSRIASEALSIDPYDVYAAYCIENLGNGLYVSCIKEGDFTFSFRAEVPRMFKVNRKVIIKAPSNIGPVLITDEVMEEEQEKILMVGKKQKQQKVKSNGVTRKTSNNLMFRIGQEGIEFKGEGTDLIKPFDKE